MRYGLVGTFCALWWIHGTSLCLRGSVAWVPRIAWRKLRIDLSCVAMPVNGALSTWTGSYIVMQTLNTRWLVCEIAGGD